MSQYHNNYQVIHLSREGNKTIDIAINYCFWQQTKAKCTQIDEEYKGYQYIILHKKGNKSIDIFPK